MSDDAPTLQEIIQLTRHELTTAQVSDSIRECGRAALSLLPSDPELCLKLAYQKLHDVPYKEVKTCWRRLYTDASLWKVVSLVEGSQEDVLDIGESDRTRQSQKKGDEEGEWIDEAVRLLDMALILAGAPGREEVVELWFAALKRILPSHCSTEVDIDIDALERPPKRRKLSPPGQTLRMPSSFPADSPEPMPTLRHPIPRTKELSLSAFQSRLNKIETHTPLIIEGAIQHWPALEERPWHSPGYLLEQTLGGRRLVPVEVGKSYTDEGWGQRIVTFREFMDTYMLDGHIGDDYDQEAPKEKARGKVEDTRPTQNFADQATSEDQTKQTGYLAQHDLFAQIPSLRADISIPDYCYCDPTPSPHLTHIKPTSKLEEPLLNAWFGPAGTVSPLHTDPYHNILAQVVGYKYVRLYAPGETEKLHPRSVDESGVDMSNTSQVDLDEAMAVYPELSCWGRNTAKDSDGTAISSEHRKEFEGQYPGFKEAKYFEGILEPGDCLYLPVGWWHYVSSLTPSFSVSFWFN